MTLYLTAAPDRLAQARAATAQLAHAAYRIGLGSQLLAAPLPAAQRGGLLVVSDRQAPAVEQPEPLARQLVRVCLRRGFSGVVLDLEELLEVSGVGVVKAEKYGERFLHLLALGNGSL